jgi:hypothetical protein
MDFLIARISKEMRAMFFKLFLVSMSLLLVSGKEADSFHSRLLQKAQELKKFAKLKGYNEQLAFFIDMREGSGLARFVIYNLASSKIEKTGLVTHGRCNKLWLYGRSYSNKIGSGCTSLGIYKVGGSYQGKFGLAYKLHGLSATNNNAYARYVVLHAMECVPEQPVHPKAICQSDGCPAVSPLFMKGLHARIQSEKKPPLLYIYQ